MRRFPRVQGGDLHPVDPPQCREEGTSGPAACYPPDVQYLGGRDHMVVGTDARVEIKKWDYSRVSLYEQRETHFVLRREDEVRRRAKDEKE